MLKITFCMKTITEHIRIWVFAMLFLALFLYSGLSLAASSARGYKTSDPSLQVGMAVSLSSDSSSESESVELSTNSNGTRFVGIVTSKDSNLLTLSDASSAVYVVSAGQAQAFVSNMSGDIKKGDLLTVTPLKGILAKAQDRGEIIVGIAAENFNSDLGTKRTVKKNDGSDQEVSVGLISAEISPPRSQLEKEEKQSFLVVIGESITGKVVNQWQVLAAAAIFISLVIVEGSIIYGATYSTIQALGRNPLAKSAIFRQLFQVAFMAIAVLAFGGATIYTILWL